MPTSRLPRRAALAALLPAAALALTASGEGVDPRVLSAEADRVAVVEKLKPSVVAVFDSAGQGGGSGVLITRDGYALTNFHVVQGAGPVMRCGLADGVLYNAVLVGIDKVGDVALIKLFPRRPDQFFTPAPLGDSDQVKAGDWSLAMGNPFLLATDFTPTVTFGLVSGVHRYQYPAGTLLEYTDCIQIDTSINPGNSGGPLFNLRGELIGINGRGSFEKRARVNSGVGYAISINQIKNFLGHLRAGLDADHATLGAALASETDEDEGGAPRLMVREVLEHSDAARRGLQAGDELMAFAGRPVTSVNQYKNVLGLYPRGWRVPLTYRRGNEKQEVLVRLMQLQRQQPDDEDEARRPPRPRPGIPPQPPRPKVKIPPALAKYYKPGPGFANAYFNQLERDRLWAAFRQHGDFAGVTGEWSWEGTAEIAGRRTDARLVIGDQSEGQADKAKGVATHPLVRLWLGSAEYRLDALKFGQGVEALQAPTGSGGLLTAFYHYRRLLTAGPAGFEQQAIHGGHEPYYALPVSGSAPAELKELRVDTEVLRTEHNAVPARWYFSLTDQSLLGFEVTVSEDADPCEVYLSDYRPAEGRQLPHRIEVRHADKPFAVFTIKSYKLASAK